MTVSVYSKPSQKSKTEIVYTKKFSLERIRKIDRSWYYVPDC
jgi:hypothetical protein